MSSTKSRLVIFGVTMALLGASAHAYQLAIEWQRVFNAELIALASPFYQRLQVFLVLSFLMVAIGLLMRKKIGLLVSIFGLIGVLVGHIGWYAYTDHLLRVYKAEPFYTQHPQHLPSHLIGLGGARWWDIAILLSSVLLLIWEITELTARRKRESV